MAFNSSGKYAPPVVGIARIGHKSVEWVLLTFHRCLRPSSLIPHLSSLIPPGWNGLPAHSRAISPITAAFAAGAAWAVGFSAAGFSLAEHMWISLGLLDGTDRAA